MMVAKLAGPMIISRLGEMTSSFLFLAFVGHFLPGSLGYASFAWAFISLSTVVGIGFFSTLMFDVAGANSGNVEKVTALLDTGIRLACVLGGVVVAGVLCYLIFNSDDSENLASTNGIVMLVMSLSIPAIYLQIVVFNYFNALGQPRLELIFVWVFNAIFLIAAAVRIKIDLNISMTHFALAYISLRWTMVLIVFALIKIKHEKVFANFNGPISRWANYRGFLLRGAPLALCFGGESFLYFAFSIIAKDMGGLELAAYQASLHFLSVIYMISIGIGNATAILTAQSFTEHRLSAVRVRFFEGLGFGAILLVPCLVVCVCFSDFVAGLYSSDVEVRRLIGKNIEIAAPFLLFEFIYVVVRMVLRSLGDSWVPTAATIFCLNGLGLSIVWLFFEFFQHDIKYMFWSLTICTFVLMVFLVWRLIKFFMTRRKQYLTTRLA